MMHLEINRLTIKGNFTPGSLQWIIYRHLNEDSTNTRRMKQIRCNLLAAHPTMS